MRGGSNVLITSWNHLDVSSTTYDGGDTGGDDTVTLSFQPSSFRRSCPIRRTAANCRTISTDPATRSGSSPTPEPRQFRLECRGDGFRDRPRRTRCWRRHVTYDAIGDDLPNFMSGGKGNGSNNTLVASAAGQTLNGNNGNDILVAHSSGSTLNGGGGADLLLGAAGTTCLKAERQRYRRGQWRRRHIRLPRQYGPRHVIDFTPGIDKIDLGESDFDRRTLDFAR